MQTNEFIRTVKSGMNVMYGEFPGTIRAVCEWSRAIVDGVEGVMVEVRLPGGVACVSAHDLVAA